jgi:hypothetical protein
LESAAAIEHDDPHFAISDKNNNDLNLSTDFHKRLQTRSAVSPVMPSISTA